jgi:hypothetical protein
VASGEASNHFGEDEIRAGVQAGQTILGGLQFDLSQMPGELEINAAAVVLTGLRWDNQPATGTWKLELLDRELVEGWSDADYGRIANAATTLTMHPGLRVDHLGAERESVWYVNTFDLDRLGAAIRDNDSVVMRLRYEASSASHSSGQAGLFVWEASGTFRINFAPAAEATQTTTPILRATETPTVATTTATASTLPATVPPPATATATVVGPPATVSPTPMATATPLQPKPTATNIPPTATATRAQPTQTPSATATRISPMETPTAVLSTATPFGPPPPPPGNSQILGRLTTRAVRVTALKSVLFGDFLRY